jgi:hypothetical protein
MASTHTFDGSSGSNSSTSQTQLTQSKTSSASRHDFEVVLEESRVYTRVDSNNESDASFTSSTVRTNAWSMLSGISLNDISIIAVFRLPITLDDINKFGPGLKFGALLSEQALRVASSQPEINPPQNQVATNQTPHHLHTQPLPRSPGVSTPLNPHNMSISPPGASTPISRGRQRRGSESSNSSGGFMDALGPEKWYIGGRTAGGEEKFYRLGLVTSSSGRRVRSLDRLSL